jgi:cytochrome c biogenesis protein CcdA
MKELIKKVTSPWGGFIVGLLISLFLLPCTSGPYIIILGLLAAKTTFFKAFLYLIFYNLIFIAPMAVIVLGMYFGLPPEKAENWRKNKIRLLHLIAGVVLIALGVVIIFGLI